MMKLNTHRAALERAGHTMTRGAALALAATLAACGGSEPTSSDGAQAAQAGLTAAAVGDPICFFEHVNYQGQSYCASADSAWVGSAWNDRISSVRVPAGYRVVLFEHINYGGRSVTLTADTASLVPLNSNDFASSFRITPPVAAPSPVASVQLAQSLLFNSDDSALVLVANKAVLVKVNVTSGATQGAKPSGVLRVDNVNGGASRDLLLAVPSGALPATVPQVPSFNDSYTVTVPAELVRAGLRISAQIGTGQASTLTPRVGGGVTMKFIPISVQIAGTSGVLPANQGPHVQALFPVSSVAVQSHPTYVSSRVGTLPTTDAGWSDAFGKILGELADLHSIEGAASHDHYFGFIPKRSWGLAGLAYVRGNSGVGFDMPGSPTTVRDVVAHELGHNFSLPHAACGGAGNPDPNYPYPDATLGKPGRYIWPYLADSNTFYDPRPTDRHDMMSYCGGQVFSDYNYRLMQTYLTPADRLVVTEQAAAVATTQELLLISGEIGAGTATLNPVKSLVGRAQAPAAGAYLLRIVTTNGTTVELPFAPRVIDHEPTLQHFGFTIPNPGTIQSLSILQGSKTLLTSQARAAAGTERAQAASTAPQVQEANGSVSLSWDAARHPYLTLTWVSGNGERRNLAQDLRDGRATLSTAELPAGGSFEIVLSDGLNAVRLTRAR